VGLGPTPAVRFFLVVRKNLTKRCEELPRWEFFATPKGFLPPIDCRDGGPGHGSFRSFRSFRLNRATSRRVSRRQLHPIASMQFDRRGVGTGDGRATTRRVLRDARCVTSAARAGPRYRTLRGVGRALDPTRGPGHGVVSFVSFKPGDVAPGQPPGNCIQLHRCNWMEGVGTGDGRATTNRAPRDAKCMTFECREDPKCHTARRSRRPPLRPVARATDRFVRFVRFV